MYAAYIMPGNFPNFEMIKAQKLQITLEKETGFQQIGTNTGDSYQDVEVEFNGDGSIAGYVVGGLGFCPDTVRVSNICL